MPTIPIAKIITKISLLKESHHDWGKKYGFPISISSVTDTDTGQKTSVM